MSGEMGRGQTSTFLHVDGVGVDVNMQSQLAKDPMDFGDIPGLDPDAGVVGGVDAAIEDDGCAGGACKI